jgi:hypothetical protein
MEGSGIAPDELARLADFFQLLRDLLSRLISRTNPLLSDRAIALLATAWEELEAEHRFEDAQRLIRSGDFDAGLTDHGLRGEQLRLKLDTAERAIEAFDRQERRLVSRVRTKRRILTWALKAANVVVDSVAIVVPPVAAIKEFKNSTEVALGEPVPVRERIRRRFSRRGKTIGVGVGGAR